MAERTASGAKPRYELRRKVGTGAYQSYASVYTRPLRIWVLGRWLVGRR